MQSSRHEANFRMILAVYCATMCALGGFAASAAGQTKYVFGRADFPTGNKPVAVVTGDFNGDGKPDLAVVNQGDNTVSILLGKPDGTFAPQVTYAVGSSPSAVVVGDFNGDKKLDLAVTNGVDNTVSILLGNGDGTFQAAVAYATGHAPSSVAAADFNSDGKPDLAVANNADNTVSILLGNGDGTFGTHTDFATGPSPTAVATGDFNNEGTPDLIVAGAGASILLGQGDGTFRTATGIVGGAGPESVAVGDINRDGKLDVIVADFSSSIACILLGNGDGTFSFFNDVSTGTEPSAVLLGDFNGDGRLDFATADQGSNTVTVRLQNGTPAFFNFQNPPVPYFVDASPASFVSADFNGDGKPDLAVTSLTSNIVSVFLGSSAGTFESRTDYDLDDTRPRAMVAGDFNGDGKPDLAVAETNTSFPGLAGLVTYLGNGDGTFQSPVANETLIGGSLATGDFNGDGKLDVALANVSAPPSLSIELGNGDGTFTTAGTVTGPCGPISAADLRADGKQDVVVADSALNQVAVLLGNGDGTLQAPVNYTTGTDPVAVAVADFNGDGKLDLAVADANCPSSPCGPGSVSILLGNGDGTFQPHVDYATGAGPFSIVAGDFNNDGRVDLAVTNIQDQTVSVLLGNGDGTFQTHVDYPVPNAAGLAAADFNGDGKLDLAVGGGQFTFTGMFETAVAGTVSILFGNGDGTFRAHTDYTVAGATNSLLSADFNNDGAPDLAVLTSNNSQVPEDSVLSALLNTPVVALFPYSLTFPNTLAGATSASQTITISNPGVGKLTVSSISASGDFAETNNCASSLAAGANCTVTVTFTPSAEGTRTGTLTLTDGAATSPQVISLNGTGVNGSMVSLSAISLNFGTEAVGGITAPQIVTLTNTGNAPLFFQSFPFITLGGPDAGDFQICSNMSIPGFCHYQGSSDCHDAFGLGLPPGFSCTVGLAFQPNVQGTRTAALSFSDLAVGSPQTVALTGVGVLAPVESLSPPFIEVGLTFAPQPTGTTSAAQTATLTNIGSAVLGITSITASGDFAETNNCGASLAIGASCAFSVTFKPTVTGLRFGMLTVAGNAFNSPQSIGFCGTGTGPAPVAALSASSLSFAAPLGSTSPVQTLTLTNTGNLGLVIRLISVSGDSGASGAFAETNSCHAVLLPGKSCLVNVTFTPPDDSPQLETLTFTDDASTSPQFVFLEGFGSGFGPAAILSPNPLAFPATVPGSASAPLSVTLTNSGAISLTLEKVTATGDFRLVAPVEPLPGGCGTTVAAGTSCTISSVIFAPMAAGNRTGSLILTDNAGNSPQSVALTGTGSDFQLNVSGSSSATVNPGQTATYTIVPEGVNAFTGNVPLTCSGAPSKATCALSPNPVFIPGPGMGIPQAAVVVTVATTAPSLAPPLGRRRWTLPPSGLPAPRALFWLALLALTMVAAAGIARQRRRSLALAVLTAALLGVALAVSCGGGTSAITPPPTNPGTPAGTFSLTVTGTFTQGSVTLSHTANLTLVVQ